MTGRPPRLAERLLAWSMRDPRWRECVLGDLSEEFIEMTSRAGASRARSWYRKQAVGIAARRFAARLTGRPLVPDRLPELPEPRAGLSGALWHDLRHAWRIVRHQPALSLTVILVLAVAIAANGTVFSVADAMVLRPFRYAGVDRAVVIASDGHQRFFARESVTPGDFMDWREQAGDAFSRLAALEWWDPAYSHDGPPQQLAGFRVSASLFDILGTRAELGRTLAEADGETDAAVAVLSHAFWVRQFGARPDVLGRTIWLDTMPHRVVGVMPPAFTVPFGADVWAPLAFRPEARSDRSNGHLMVVAQLASGVSVEGSEQRLLAILAQQKKAYPETHAKREVSVRSFTEGFGDPGAGPFIAVWQVAAFLLLLVACANVANLLLARNTERQRELAVRLALGASGRRITWQLLLESLVLAVAASLLSVPLIWAGLQAIRVSLPDAVIRFVPGMSYMRLQPATFLATSLLAVCATVVAAMIPALRASRGSMVESLRPGTRVSDGRNRQRGRAVLATAQIALTLALLATAGLSLSALYRVTSGPIGFDTVGILTGKVSLPDTRYSDAEKRRQFVDAVLGKLSALPSVVDAAVATNLPYGGTYNYVHFWPEGVPVREFDRRRHRAAGRYAHRAHADESAARQRQDAGRVGSRWEPTGGARQPVAGREDLEVDLGGGPPLPPEGRCAAGDGGRRRRRRRAGLDRRDPHADDLSAGGAESARHVRRPAAHRPRSGSARRQPACRGAGRRRRSAAYSTCERWRKWWKTKRWACDLRPTPWQSSRWCRACCPRSASTA